MKCVVHWFLLGGLLTGCGSGVRDLTRPTDAPLHSSSGNGDLVMAGSPSPDSVGESIAESHQDLTWYPASTGKRERIETLPDWERRREAILDGFEEAAGALPPREALPDLIIEIEETIETEAYRRDTLTIQAEAGDRLSAYRYVPKGIEKGERRGGIVALHPTHTIGKGVVDGQSERPNRAYAKELAERGYVVVAPDYVSFGGESDYDFADDRYESGTMKGIWNHSRAVDLLVATPEVDPGRIGAIGHSLGGHNAIFLGVFDSRVKVIVSSCGWTPFHDYYGGRLKGWTKDCYLPALRDRYELDPDQVPFDFPELVAALAPRAFFSNSPLGDGNFDYRGVEKAAPKIRWIYELHGVPDHLRITYPDAGHDFPLDEREESYRFLDRFLGDPPKTRDS